MKEWIKKHGRVTAIPFSIGGWLVCWWGGDGYQFALVTTILTCYMAAIGQIKWISDEG